MGTQDAAAITCAYHQAWTARNFAGAAALLVSSLVVEAPVNHYPAAESFAAALASFGPW